MNEQKFLADLVGFGREVDILPYAQAVVNECPYPHDISAIELAEFTMMSIRGKYINVDIQDRVGGRMLHSMIRQRMGRVGFFHHDRAQLLDHEARRFTPNTELLADIEVCAEAADMTGRFLDDDELKPIPLPSCWGHSCFCSYTTRSKDSSPHPAVTSTFTGVEEIESEDDDPDT